MKDNKKMSTLILVLILMITAVISGTFAYWQWITSAEQQTLVNVSLTDDATIYIDFPSNELTNLYPTSDCEANGTSSWVTDITVNNGTGYNGDAPVNIIGIENWNTSNTINMTAVFFDANISEIDLSSWNVCNVTDYGDFSSIVNIIQPHFGEPAKCNGGNPEPNFNPRAGEAIAIFSEDDRSLRFYREENPASVTVGSTYNGRTVTEVYTGFETTGVRSWSYSEQYAFGEEMSNGEICEQYSPYDYGSYCELPWNLNAIVFEDYIYPTSTKDWFRSFGIVSSIDVTKLDTSNVTNMSGMFSFANNTYNYNDVVIIGMENWDTSKVTNMMDMFSFVVGNITGIGSWDVSNVTNMSGMFGMSNIDMPSLENWDVSNVTNMLDMFAYASGNITGLENWDVSNVTEMSGMFDEVYTNPQLDLSGWRVCKISTKPYGFDSSNVIQPNWGMTC